MITDEMLSIAAGEVSLSMVESVPDFPHAFSQRFEKKLRALTRRAEHPVSYQVLRHAAAVLIVVSVGLGVLMAASPTVRAAVIGWVRSTFGSLIQYSTDETTPPDAQYDYCLPEAFDGYALLTAVDREHGKLCIYSNAEGEILQFEYIYGEEGAKLFVKPENTTHYSDFVGSLPADIYISTNGDNCVIVWKDPAANILFWISMIADKDDLIAVAEKVEKIDISEKN